MDLEKLLEAAKEAAFSASKEIIDIYETGDFSIEAKSDHSPLTKADKASHQAIVEILDKTNLPILSEEGKEIPYEERKDWEYFWMIDPLDGTKEFIKKNGEFTVNIALIHQQKAILGVVLVPVSNKIYYSISGRGAFVEDGSKKQIEVNKTNKEQSGIKVVASRSHLNEETEHFMQGLNKPEIVSMGSSLKLLAVAEGTADLYPRYAPTMEWDTAAAQAIVEESGGTVCVKNQQISVSYNKKDLLNPHFLVSCNLAD